MKRTSFSLGVTVICVMCAWSSCRAQTVEYMVKFPIGVRNIGMGAGGAADASGVATGYFNPASLAWSRGVVAEGSRGENYLGQKYTELGLAAGNGFPQLRDLDGWTLNGRLTYVQENPVERESYCYYPDCVPHGDDNYYIAASGAFGLRRGAVELAVGATARYLENRVDYYFNVWSYDLGVLLALNLERKDLLRVRPRFGVSARNLGEDVIGLGRYDGYYHPRNNLYAFGVDFASPSGYNRILGRDIEALMFSADFDFFSYGRGGETPKAYGFEASLFETIHARFGTSRMVIPGYYETLTYGLGASYVYRGMELRLDWAVMHDSSPHHYYDYTLRRPGDKDFFGITLCSRAFPFPG